MMGPSALRYLNLISYWHTIHNLEFSVDALRLCSLSQGLKHMEPDHKTPRPPVSFLDLEAIRIGLADRVKDGTFAVGKESSLHVVGSNSGVLWHVASRRCYLKLRSVWDLKDDVAAGSVEYHER